MNPIRGLHHITAVAKEPQRNVDFYEAVLGQRLVKTTVNFDDPGTYHLYYGDKVGSPGTIMTFFPWRHVAGGRPGNGETAAVAYAIPAGSTGFWLEHLARTGIRDVSRANRFGVDVIRFSDAEGMALELVPLEAPAPVEHWDTGPIPAEHALRGFYGVTLWLDQIEPTGQLLAQEFGYRFSAQDENYYRFNGDMASLGPVIDLLHRPGGEAGRFGAGSIHHIAFRVQDDDEQRTYQASLRQAGVGVTPVRDRQYFHSIYFREPGGVLFELATNPPGFTLDEPVEQLGAALKLPPWLEQHRARIEQALPHLERGRPAPAEVSSD